MEITLETPVQFVPRVGPSYAGKLEKLGILTTEDLLYYAPFRYNDYTVVSDIRDIAPGEIVTITGTVESFRNIFTKNGKRMQEAVLTDKSGSIPIVWFNQMFLSRVILPGSTLHVAGKADWFGKKLSLFSPEYEIIAADQGEASLHTGRLVPVYSETAGISSKWIRGRIAYLLKTALPLVTEFLPSTIRSKHNLPDLHTAINDIHFPKSIEDADQARRRLSFDEFLLLQLTAYEQKRQRETTERTTPLSIDPTALQKMLTSLPFELTQDQHTATSEVIRDMGKNIPMNRLLEGDVGSGKTVVAAIAMYAASVAGRQSVLMAPTQILAQQHYDTIQALLTPHGLHTSLITGNHKKNVDTPLLSHTDVYVGTHALLSQSVLFDNVGLVVIDEQQRFGVDQRKLIREKGSSELLPHLLTMTATPIPRTIALTLYGNLELSTIHQMPKGRQVIKTWVVPDEKREKAYAWISDHIKKEHTQAFIVCPIIESSESMSSVKAATVEYTRLQKEVFPHLSLGLLHGRMKPTEKSRVLAEFRESTHDILVTTPVVEVGIDVPNATIMMIEGAERFGLAQLHQLRGRVGRGSKQSYCLLFTDSIEEKSITRLKALESIHNGPELAELDLILRGPGDLFGTRQHGLPNLRFARFSDLKLIQETKTATASIVSADPALLAFPLLREKLNKSTIGEYQD